MKNRKIRRCLIWGIGKEYDSYTNQIHYEILKGNMEVTAYVSKDLFCEEFEGRPVISPDKISKLDFEYIIVCNTVRFQEISKEAQHFGIFPNKILDAGLFLLPCFDLNRYVNLLENPVTIIADDCWGANAYHYLKLPFTTPFILCYMMPKDYLKILQDLSYYMTAELEMLQEGDRNKLMIPKGMLGDDSRRVILNFNHSLTFKKAREEWEERKKRINWSNIFVKMTVTDRETARIFQELPYLNKVAFSNFQSSYDSVQYLCEWDWNAEHTVRYVGFDFAGYARNSVEGRKAKDYDILKLLNGEKDYMRKRGGGGSNCSRN